MGMEMISGGMTPAEAVLLTDRDRRGCCNDGNGFFNGDGSWVLFLFFLLAMGNGWGNGWGGFGGFGGGAGGFNAVATNADLQRGFDTQSIIGKLDGINNGLCDGFYAVNNGMLTGFNGIQRDLCTGFNGINQNINQSRFDAQQCCCETNRNIDAVRYENARNTCDIVTAIKEDGAATRALMTQNTIQELRDQLQAAQLQLGNISQTQTLVNELKPCARPAYLTCSPYQSYNFPYGQGFGFNGGCGCGCN